MNERTTRRRGPTWSWQGILAHKRRNLALLAMILTALVGGIYAGGAIQPLDHDAYGIVKNTITHTVDYRQIYEGGIYHLGFGRQFITFPRMFQSTEFSDVGGADAPAISARTAAGLAISLELSYQYRVVRAEIPQLYQAFGDDYRNVVLRQSRDILRDVAGRYSATEFFYNRSEIGDVMQAKLASDLRAVHVEVGYFQLREVAFPPTFEAALERLEVQQQEVEAAEAALELARLEAETVIVAAYAEANASLIGIEVQARALNISLRAESAAYAALADELGLNSTELLAYLWVQAVREHDSAWLVIGEETPDLVLLAGNRTGA